MTLALTAACVLGGASMANAFHGNDSALKLGKNYTIDLLLYCNTKEDVADVIDAKVFDVTLTEKTTSGSCTVATNHSVTVKGLADDKLRKSFGGLAYIVEVVLANGKMVFMYSDVPAEKKPTQ